MKYIIEGDIDFFKELKKDDETNIENIKTNHCYITTEPLVEHFITLNCNHAFNYLPLFYTTYNQKYKANFKTPQTKCPYCRKKQPNFILPYIPELINVKILGVNSNDPNSRILCNTVGCVSEIVKCNYDDNCFNLGSTKISSKLICSYHYTSQKQQIIKEQKLAYEADKIAKAQALILKKQTLILKKQAIEGKKQEKALSLELKKQTLILKKQAIEKKKQEKANSLELKKATIAIKKEAVIQSKLIKQQQMDAKKEAAIQSKQGI